MKDEIRDLIERVAEVEASKEELSKFNKFNLKKSFIFYIYLNSFDQLWNILNIRILKAM